MTFIAEKTCICSVCGKTVEYGDVVSSNSFGSADLDLRPSVLGMMRYTNNDLIHECEFCGYTNFDLDKKTTVDRQFLCSRYYHSKVDIGFKSEIAHQYYKGAIIACFDRDAERAFMMLLRAAWASDDAGDKGMSVFCRKKAIFAVNEVIKENPEDEEYYLMKIDIMRRAGMFSEVIDEFEHRKTNIPMVSRIIKFQVKLAKEHDEKRYTIEEALKAIPNTPFGIVYDGVVNVIERFRNYLFWKKVMNAEPIDWSRYRDEEDMEVERND